VDDVEKQATLRRVLGQFTQKELFQIISSLKSVEPFIISQTAKKDFIISKILDNFSFTDITKNEQVSQKIFEELQSTFGVFENIFTQLSMDDLEVICNDLNKKDIFETKKIKIEIIHELLINIGIENLWKSKRFRDRFTPKYITKTDLDTLNRNINSLKEELLTKNAIDKNGYSKLMYQIEKMLKEDLSITKNEINKLNKKFTIENGSRFNEFLSLIYNESLQLNKKLSLEDLTNINSTIKQKFSNENFAYLLSGLELMLTHYFLENIQNFEIKPNKELFWEVLREEFNKIRQIGDRAEIPALRELVCARLGISEHIFDVYLEESWKNGEIRLDIGAPIGRRDVKYLITKEGTRFFYITLSR